jgi:hypothetical protein
MILLLKELEILMYMARNLFKKNNISKKLTSKKCVCVCQTHNVLQEEPRSFDLKFSSISRIFLITWGIILG